MEKISSTRRPFMARALGAIAALPLVQACTSAAMPRQPAAAQGGRFEFGVVGDIPYTRAQEAEYARVMNDMNARDLAFVTHIGDCMFDPRPYERDPSLARMPMTDDNYAYVLGTFQACRHPLVLTPGDNDWSDAVQFKKIKVSPLERLQKLRATFYPREGTLGQRSMPVVSQARDAGHGRLHREGDELFHLGRGQGSRDGVDLDLLVGDVGHRVDRQAHEVVDA